MADASAALSVCQETTVDTEVHASEARDLALLEVSEGGVVTQQAAFSNLSGQYFEKENVALNEKKEQNI